MKKTLVLLLALTILALGAAVALAALSGTPHDLRTTGANETCAFCHTPHLAVSPDTTGPLWNRNQAAQAYTPYTSATFEMGPATVPQYGTGACAVCHNGVASTLVNVPGPGSIVNSSYNFQMGVAPYNSTYATWANLGLDLKNDHPVGFTYNASLDTGGSGIPATIPAQFKLYGTGRNQFECATCHAVHHTPTATYTTGTWDNTNKTYTSVPAGAQVYFLRTSNAESAMCRACHPNF